MNAELDPRAGVSGPDWLGETLALSGISRFVDVEGARIHYLVWGEDVAARSSKPVLVLCHGFRANAHWWDAVAPCFAERYKVIAPDLSGMGDSEHRRAYSRGGTVFARDLIGVVERESTVPVVAVGHSYGGSRILEACTVRPGLFAHVVALDTLVLFDDEPLPVERVSARARVYPDLAQAMERFRLLPEQPVASPRLLRHLARHSLRRAEGGWTWKFDVNLPSVPDRESSVKDLLGKVESVVDYVYGERSLLVDARRAQRIVSALRRGRGPFAIPNAHHHAMLDQPIALIGTLRALLGRGP